MGQVERHPADERPWAVVAADLVPLAKRDDKRIVGEVLGRPAVATDRVDDGSDRSQLPPVQIVEVDPQRVVRSDLGVPNRRVVQNMKFPMLYTRTTASPCLPSPLAHLAVVDVV
jgi:hypothetical protein